MTKFRLATINVNTFRRRSDNKSNILELISILRPLELDLIAVQEIQNNDEWVEFYQQLSLPYGIYGSCYGNSFGNGIASRYPIHSYSNQKSSFYCGGDTRSILQCSLHGIPDLTFAVTHLDHLNEDVRLAQISEFNPYKKNIDILIGDMNALTRGDYSNNYYRHIVFGRRVRSKWERPRFDLTTFIKHHLGYQDIFKQRNPHARDQHAATCYYGTRIDYIYVQPRVNRKWALTQCSIINTNSATDHNAVFAELRLKV